MASSASTLQWILTGGSESSATICVFWIASASSSVLPLIHSVAREELAMAEPQPKVLNFVDDAVALDLDLKFHDVAALRCADDARADVGRALVERAHVARVVVVVEDLVAVCHARVRD